MRAFTASSRTGAKAQFAVLSLAYMVLCAPMVQAQPANPPTPIDWALGSTTAPVTLLEYGSLTCSHCAHFNNEILPTLKTRYIATGKVKYIYRTLPTPPANLSLALHALTRCAGPTKFHALVDAFYERQVEVFEAAVGETGPKGLIFSIAEDVGGLSFSQSEACLTEGKGEAEARAQAQIGSAAGVTATPTFFINGQRLNLPIGQPVTLETVSQAIDAAFAAAQRAGSVRHAPPSKLAPKKAKASAKGTRR